MIIWHAGADATPETVNGVNATVWTVARAQAALDHRVTLLLDRQPSTAALAGAQRDKVRLAAVPGGRWAYRRAELAGALADNPPDIVHMHSVFIPQQIGLARLLRARSIPYVVTPNGGLDRNILARKPIRKWLYGFLWERPRIRNAAAVTAVLPAEVREIERYIGKRGVPTPVVPNPIDAAFCGELAWKEPPKTPRLAYLGRFDVYHKGIDRLIEIARLLPAAEFRLYGPPGAALAAQAKLRPPENVMLLPPVYGAAKIDVLLAASACIQTSRWEAFGISIAEAMALGVPCAVTSSMKISKEIESAGAGLILPEAPAEAAALLAHWLEDRQALALAGARGRSLARAAFSDAAVARSYLELYGQLLRSVHDRVKGAGGRTQRVGWA